mgnify:CR=1 FL=1
MKKNRLGIVEYVLMGIGLIVFAIALPILVPVELWLRHKENKEMKKRNLNADR